MKAFLILFVFAAGGLQAQKSAQPETPYKQMKGYVETARTRMVESLADLKTWSDMLEKELKSGKVNEATALGLSRRILDLEAKGLVLAVLSKAGMELIGKTRSDYSRDDNIKHLKEMMELAMDPDEYDKFSKKANGLLDKAVEIMKKQGTPLPPELRRRTDVGTLWDPQLYRGFFYFF